MNKQQEALRLALEALEYISSHYMSLPKIGCMALAAIEEALAEQPKESPKFDPNESFAREEAAQARVREFMRNH